MLNMEGGFSFNQFLIVDDDPLFFHTGPRKMFPLVQEAVKQVMPVERLRYISFSHVEADILSPSEAFSKEMDYFSHTKNARALLERLASTAPPHWPACTVAHGEATATNSFAPLPIPYQKVSLNFSNDWVH